MLNHQVLPIAVATNYTSFTQIYSFTPHLLICSGFDLHELVAGELILQFSITKNFPTLVLTKNEENHSNYISH